MNTDPTRTSDRDRRLDEIVTAFLKAVEGGERPEPQAWLERYPDLAGELSSLLCRPAAGRRPGRQRDHRPAGRQRYAGENPLHRRLRTAGGDRPRRHGRGLQGPAGQRSTASWPLKMILAGRAGLAGRRAPLSAGSRGGRQSRSSEHRADLRSRRTRRAALLQHEADRGRQPSAEASRRSRWPAQRRPRPSWPWWPGPSIMPISAASCTATSSRPISCSTSRASRT